MRLPKIYQFLINAFTALPYNTTTTTIITATTTTTTSATSPYCLKCVYPKINNFGQTQLKLCRARWRNRAQRSRVQPPAPDRSLSISSCFFCL